MQDVVDKEQLLRSYDPEKRKWQIAESTDHQVWLQGEVALLLGRWRGKGVNDGIPFDYYANFLAVYVLEQGEWRMLTEYSSTELGE